MNTVFDTDSYASLNNLTFNTPEAASSFNAASSGTTSPEAASSFNPVSSTCPSSLNDISGSLVEFVHLGDSSCEGVVYDDNAYEDFNNNLGASRLTALRYDDELHPVNYGRDYYYVYTCCDPNDGHYFARNDQGAYEQGVACSSPPLYANGEDAPCCGNFAQEVACSSSRANEEDAPLNGAYEQEVACPSSRANGEDAPLNGGYVQEVACPSPPLYANGEDAPLNGGYVQEVACLSPRANGEDAPLNGAYLQNEDLPSPRLYVDEEDAPLNGGYVQEVALQSPHANGEDAPRYGAYVPNVVLPHPRLYANEEDAPLNGGYVQEMVIPLPPPDEEFPSEVLTFLLREHPYEFVPFYRQRYGGNRSNLSGKEVSNWVFLYKIQRVDEAWLTMEDVATSMWKKFTTKKQPRKLWGRYVFQDAEHEWLCVWVNYLRSTTVTNQIGGGQFGCGAKYACINYTPVSFAQDEGSRVLDQLTEEHLLALGDIFFVKEIKAGRN